MTLHQTVENAKKVSIGTGIGIVVIIILVIVFRVGIMMYNIMFPPPVQPPTLAYKLLPPLKFPRSVTTKNFSYKINTDTGDLPTDFPDRLTVFRIIKHAPNYDNINIINNKIGTLGQGFLSNTGDVIPYKSLGNAIYEWDESSQPLGVTKKIKFNINTFDFNLSSDYLNNNTVLAGLKISDRTGAIATAQEFLESMRLLPPDIDLSKTENPPNNIRYNSLPQLYKIDSNVGRLIPVSAPIDTQVIRVDFYQKDIEYDLNTGITNDKNILTTKHVKIPILYPSPPYSTMSLWVASGVSVPEVMAADFLHQDIEIPKDYNATYYIKSVKQAYAELQSGNAYIASFTGDKNEVLINNIYYAYYVGKDPQDYLMPIIVFEGDSGFIAYVSAIKDDELQ